MPVDAESKKFLEEVKKGKPRRFAMACKGVKILSLIVYKKGTEEKYKKQIKKQDGAGQFFGGVVSGKGKDIVFELLADDYDKPPGKDVLLKQYLEAEAGMSLKPVYSIVGSLSPVDAPIETQAAESAQPETNEADVVDASPSPADTALTSQLTAALNKLAPLIKQAATAHPDRKPEIMQPVVVIRASIDEGALGRAKEELLQYGRFLKELTADVPRSAAADDADASRVKKEEKDEKIAAQLHALLDSLRPTLDRVVEAHPSAEDDLIDTLSDIVDQIEAKQFSQAKQNLGTFGNTLKRLLAEAEVAAPPPSASHESSPLYTEGGNSGNPLYEGREDGVTGGDSTGGTATSDAKQPNEGKAKGSDEGQPVKEKAKATDEEKPAQEQPKDTANEDAPSKPGVEADEPPPNWDACGISGEQTEDIKRRTKDKTQLRNAVTGALTALDGGKNISADPASYPGLLESALEAREKLDDAKEDRRKLALKRDKAKIALQEARKAKADADAAAKKPSKRSKSGQKDSLAEQKAAAAKRVQDAEEALQEAQRKVDEKDPGIAVLQQEFKKSQRDPARAADKRTLLDEMQHGALSESADPKLTDEQAQKLITAFGANPSAGKEALRQIAKIKDAEKLEAFIAHVENTVGAFERLYPGDDRVEDRAVMATNAIQMGARMGQEYIDGFQRYYASDAPQSPDKSGGMSERKSNETKESLRLNDVTVKRTSLMAEAILDDQGKLDVESQAAKEAIDDMLFHPGSLKTFTPEVTEQIQSMLKLCREQGRDVERALRKCKAPRDGAASQLVRDSLDANEGDKLDEVKTRQAVMSAMMTPVAQGPVGSCASTAPLRAAVTNDPISVMNHLAEIATKGTFTGKGEKVDPIPANTSLPADGGNPLLRSLEYSIATASANGVNSDETRILHTALLGAEGGFMKSGSGLLSAKWPKPPGKKSKIAALKEQLTSDLRIEFDAGGRDDGEGGVGDGSSTDGQFRLIYDPHPTIPGDRVDIRDEEAFRDAMCKLALSRTGLSAESKEGAKLLQGIKSADFARMGELGGKPWEMSQSGAHLSQTLGLLAGQHSKMETHLDKAAGDDQSAERTASLVKNLDETFGDRQEELVSLGTQGNRANHAFNYLPKHPSREQITDPNSIESFQAKCKDEVTQRKIPAAKAARMFEAFCQTILQNWTIDHELMAALLKKVPPKKDMTPAEFADHCDSASKELQQHVCEVKASREKEDPARKPGASPTDWSKVMEKPFKNEIKAIILDAYPPPTVKLADTNWGDATYHVYFSIAPDPTTGDLTLYRQKEPGGKLQPADDYAVAQWQKLVAV